MGNICESCRDAHEAGTKQPPCDLHLDEAEPPQLEFQRAELHEPSCFAFPGPPKEGAAHQQQGAGGKAAGLGPLTTVREGEEESTTNTETARGDAAREDASAAASPRAEELEAERGYELQRGPQGEREEGGDDGSEAGDGRARPRGLCCVGGRKKRQALDRGRCRRGTKMPEVTLGGERQEVL